MNALLKRLARSLVTRSTLWFMLIVAALVVPVVHRCLADAQAVTRDAAQAQLDTAAQAARILLKGQKVKLAANAAGAAASEYAGLVAALSSLQHAFAVDDAVLIRGNDAGGFVYLADARHQVQPGTEVDVRRRFRGSSQALAAAWTQGRPQPAALVRHSGTGWFRAVTPLGPAARPEALLVMERSTAPMDTALTDQGHDLWWGALLAILGAACLGWLAGMRGLRPLRQLRQAVQVLAADDADAALPGAPGSSELAELTESIGTLLTGLRKRVETAETQTQSASLVRDQSLAQLEGVLAAMGEGLITLDARGAVVGPCSAAAHRFVGPIDRGDDALALLVPDEPTRQTLRGALDRLLNAPPEADWEARMAGLSTPLPETVPGPQARRLRLRLAPARSASGAITAVQAILTDPGEIATLSAALARCRDEQASLVRVMEARADYEAFQAEAYQHLAVATSEVRPMELVRRSVVDSVLRSLRAIGCGAERFALADAQACAEALQAHLSDLAARRDEAWPRVEHHSLLQDLVELRESLRHDDAALRTWIGSPLPERYFPLSETRLEHVIAAALGAVPTASREPLQTVLEPLRRVPVSALLRSFHGLLQDAAERMGTSVRFTVQADVEAALPPERLRALAPTLQELLRNALAHGVETPAEREQAGKAPQASLTCTAEPREAGVVFTIADDGRGIDLAHIRATAVAGGFVAAQAAATLSREDLLGLLFRPGFSVPTTPGTAPGPGVGLDVVSNDVERLGGRVRLVTRRGRGTTVQIYCPFAS